ncbi:CO dehydrogenase/acetyl-CoA synthase complex subunit epsilon [Candidatus Bathyarchaeota archaeon]|nr:CO dehydrogenase/acetyl-CoA synthase complex subunit epsilon [Candidatus Bathyarchaeota archaeon]MBL7079536.1 CO dehydrogenase/acetyl-CoA synthase complex subunit epsilon [Candidatus Bathyarchaeota archaeon]
MSQKMTLGQTAEIAGPKKAFIIPKPEVVASMIKRAKRPLLVVGSESAKTMTSDGVLVDTAIRLIGKMTVAATGHLVSEFLKRDVQGVHSISLMNLGDRLRDPLWGGFDGEGQYDLVVFAGFPYYLEWLVLNGLKSFAMDLRTISLTRSYQPNASWSLGSMKVDEWKEVLDKIASTLMEEN